MLFLSLPRSPSSIVVGIRVKLQRHTKLVLSPTIDMVGHGGD